MDCHTTALMATIATWCRVVYCAFSLSAEKRVWLSNFSSLICLQKHVFPPRAPMGKFMENLGKRGYIMLHCFMKVGPQILRGLGKTLQHICSVQVLYK
jgi:hypothetical protein